MWIEAKDGLRGRALRRRVTLICAGYSDVLEQSRMTVFRRESPHSRIAIHRESVRWHIGIAGAPDRACPRRPHFAPSVFAYAVAVDAGCNTFHTKPTSSRATAMVTRLGCLP